MAHRRPYTIYEGSSSDEGWTRNGPSSIRPSRRFSSSEGEESDHNRRTYFSQTYNVSSDSDRYQSSSDYETSDSDRRNVRPPPHRRIFYNAASDSEEYFSEEEEVEFTSYIWKRIRPRSILGALLALGMALSLPLLMDSQPLSSRSLSITKVSKLPKYMLDSVYYTTSSLLPGGTTRKGGIQRPDFVYEHPYVSSSYYTSTNNTKVLVA